MVSKGRVSCAALRSRDKEFRAAVRAARHGAQCKILAGAADAEYRDYSCRGAQREAELLACKCNLGRLPCALMPNPSFKPSPNGGPPGPVWRYAVLFRLPGPRVTPSVPA